MVSLGIAPERIVVLRNGVDLELFRPMPREEARRKLGLGAGSVVLSVGNLVPAKGHDLVIRATATLPNVTCVIVGEGSERRTLADLAGALGASDRVRFLPVVPQEELAAIYSAADVLALGSMREGWPNVLLEAMACGTPVVATDVGGVREIVTREDVGRVVASRDQADFATALRGMIESAPDRAAVRRYAKDFGWGQVSQGQVDLYATVVRDATARVHGVGA
jgi:glycosyltransferase involved in cell wall biosynthesis